MSVAVTAVAFDHGRGLPGSYTVPLRFNEAQPVLLPEWQRGNRFPSVAAYLGDRLPSIATVLVRFAVAPGESRLLEIRAGARLVAPFSPAGPLLPDLPPLLIAFTAAGDSGWCAFPLDTTGLSASVSASTHQWTWQFRRSIYESWTDFDVTFHRIYVLLSAPTAPWLVWPADPSNASLPRTDALDFACIWAAGARNEIEAATRITRAVFQLGGPLLSYDAAVGAPHYTVLGVPRFLCDAFIDRLRGGDGAGPLVNCSDCATIVSTFANLLGADLWQSKMGLVGEGFRLNPILAIGSNQWSTVLGGFSFHEVAWSGACGELNTVYDACLLTDRDPNPSRAPHIPSLPVNQVFGTSGSGQYRDQIAAPPDRDKCLPWPALRVRRPVTSQAIAFVPGVPLAFQSALAERAHLDQSAAVATEETLFEGFFFFGGELPGWSLARAASFRAVERPAALMAALPVESQPIEGESVLVTFWRRPDEPATRLRVESIETASSAHARQTLIRIAGEIENPTLEHWDRGAAGETALRSVNGAIVLFTRGNHVHVVRSAGREVVDVSKDVEALDQWLTSSGSPSGSLGPAQPAQAFAGQPVPAWRRIHLARRSSEALRAAGPSQPGPGGRAVIGEYVVTAAHAQAWNPLRT
jgi:hypothetical protein